MKNEQKESNIIISIEEMEKEISQIYPEGEDSEKCDTEINKLYNIKNWSDMFYKGKTKLIQERFVGIMSKSENSKFFEALDYEYGINNKIKNIELAFKIYKEQADNTTDILSMYKMYHIYRNEYTNFGLTKRNKVLEKYYLYKSFAYLPKYLMERYSFLLNRFNIPLEVAINILYEDNNLGKLDKLIQHIYKYNNYYNIKISDLILIKSVLIFEFKNNNLEKVKALEALKELIEVNNLEAIYKVGILILKDGNKSEKFFELLEEKKYYRSFCDYALYLFKQKKDSKKALEILKKAIDNGVIRANYLYYDILLNSIDFTEIKINDEFKDNLKDLINILINDIVTDGIYSFFEFFYLRKICIKHWNLKTFMDENFAEFTKDFIKILIDNSCLTENKEEIKQKKEYIKSIYIREEFFSEFHLSCGIIYYYGIENMINIDLQKSLSKFQISFDDSDSKSYKRFCYSYISRIKDKLYDKNNKLYTLEEKEDSKKKLFDLYYTSFEKVYMNILSSSFFYYLSKLYAKKWGNPGDEIMEYICLKKASDREEKNPGNGTIISYYRKFKAIINLKKNEEKYKIYLNNIKIKNDSEGYGDDNSLCPICFEKKRNSFLYPCKHLFCNFCIKKLLEKSECPICRKIIIFCFDLEKISDLNKENKKKIK